MNLIKSKHTMADFKQPTYSKKILAEYTDNLAQIPIKEQEKLKERQLQWQLKVDAQAVKKVLNKAFKQTQKVRDFMDQLYRWTAGPGEFGHPSRRPLLWTGNMNIHSCQNWWVSDICLYMMYPFTPPKLYQAIRGLHEVFKKLFQVPVDTEDMIQWRPTMLANLKLFTDVVPEIYHGILVHGLTHVYDYIMKTGAPAVCFTMYIFERLVALYNRLIHDRRQPEQNLVNNIDARAALLNTMHSSASPAGLQQEIQNLPMSLLRCLNLTEFAPESPEVEGNETNLPVRPRDTSTHLLGDLQQADGVDMVSALLTDLSCPIIELHSSVFVNGIQRRTIAMEPPIGTVGLDGRRTSGFKLIQVSVEEPPQYGQLIRVLSSDKLPRQCVLYVELYPVFVHEDSGQQRVQVDQGVKRYLQPEQVGNAVVFAPCFNKYQMVAAPLFYSCVLTDYPKKKVEPN
jgi:hypothetical protein